MPDPSTAGPGELPHPGPQTDEINASLILSAVGGLALAILIVHLVCLCIFAAMRTAERPQSTPFSRIGGNPVPLPRGPVLEGVEQQQGQKISFSPQDLRPEKQPELTTYGWVNREAGIVRIPLSQAVKLLTQDRPLPARQKGKGKEKNGEVRAP